MANTVGCLPSSHSPFSLLKELWDFKEWKQPCVHREVELCGVGVGAEPLQSPGSELFAVVVVVFNWGMADLGRYVSSSCTAKWISHMYTCLSSLFSPPSSHPSRSSQRGVELPVPTGWFTHGSAETSVPGSQFILPRFPRPPVSTRPLCTSASLVLLSHQKTIPGHL